MHGSNPFEQPPRPGTGGYTHRSTNRPTAPNNNNTQNEYDGVPLNETKTININGSNRSASWTKPSDKSMDFLEKHDERGYKLRQHQINANIKSQQLLNEDIQNQRKHEEKMAANSNVPALMENTLKLYEQTHKHQLENKSLKLTTIPNYDINEVIQQEKNYLTALSLEHLGFDINNLTFKDAGHSDFFEERINMRCYSKSIIFYGVQSLIHTKGFIKIIFRNNLQDGVRFTWNRGWFAQPIQSTAYKGVWIIRFGIDPLVNKGDDIKYEIIPRNCCDSMSETMGNVKDSVCDLYSSICNIS